MLTKCKGLCTTELRALLLHTAHASLTSRFMLFVAHLNIILRATSNFVAGEERAIPSIKNVDLGKVKMRIPVGVASPVASPNMLRPGNISVRAR